MPTEYEQLLNSIHLKSLLPIDWEALTQLGKELNEIEGVPYKQSDLADIKPPDEANAVIVMVASVIVNFRHPEVAYLLPSKEQIKTLRPWLGSLEKLLGKVSPKWSRRFGRHIESKGQEAVIDAGKLIIKTAESWRQFQRPRDQFFWELENLYGVVEKTVMKEGFFEDYPMPIEEKIEDLFSTFRHSNAAYSHSVNAENFPLLFSLIRKFKFPPPSLSDSHAGVVGAEMMQGIAFFLQQQGAENVSAPPRRRSSTYSILPVGCAGLRKLSMAKKSTW